MNRDIMEFCSNPKCQYTHTHKLTEPKQMYCTRCGASMLIKCSSCSKEFAQGTEKYCSDCGTAIKNVEENQ